MELRTLVQGGVMISLFGMLAFWLKGIPGVLWRIYRKKVIYTVGIYDNSKVFPAFEQTLIEYAPNSFNNCFANTYYKNNKHNLKISQDTNTFYFIYEGCKIYVNKNKEKIEVASSYDNGTGGGLYSHYYTVYTRTKNKDLLNSLLQKAVDSHVNNKKEGFVDIYAYTYQGMLKVNEVRIKQFDKIFCNEDIITNIKSDLNSFISSKGEYIRKSIPYKRGYLLYGPPGTGKSTMALAIADHVKRDIYTIDLNDIGSKDFMVMPKQLSDNTILLIEDIDAVLDGRSFKNNDKLSFSAFLNFLDGSMYKEGLIVIVTTNHIERLDAALLRAGRLDFHVKIDYPTSETINKYLSNFYQRESNIEFSCITFPMAKVQECCLSSTYDQAVESIHVLCGIEAEIETIIEKIANETLENT